MQAKLIKSGKIYGFMDFLRIPFRLSPFAASILALNTLVDALTPGFRVLVTAAFLDAALGIFRGIQVMGDLYLPMAGLVVIVLYSNLNTFINRDMNLRLEMALNRSFRAELLEKRARLQYRHIEDNDTWDLTSRVCKEPAKKMMEALGNLLTSLRIVILVASLLVLLMAQVKWVGAAVLLLCVPLFCLAVKGGQMGYAASKEAQKLTRRADHLNQVLQGRESVEERSLFGYTREISRRWHQKFEEARTLELRVRLKAFLRMKGASLITVLLSMAIIGVLLLPLQKGELTSGMFMSLITALLNLIQMMSWQLTECVRLLAEHREYLKDLTAFAALEETEGALDLPAPADPFDFRELEFRHVAFRYPGTEKWILKDFCLKMSAPLHYAFVGVNGAGKTTLAKLLTGLYDGYEGELLLNGKELRTYPEKDRKRLFSVAFQDFARYGVSLGENIALGDVLHMNDGEGVRRAAENIGLGSKVRMLPGGYAANLGKIRSDGVELSGGEWQKVALARSLFSPAQIRILDEPTAALDPVSESEVYSLFGRISEGQTTLLITHRLGAAKLADVIVVLDEGRAAEAGSHQELMEKQGLYAQMFEAQRSWYA